MCIATIILAELALCSPTVLHLDDAKAKAAEESNYVKVEIKGTLETKGNPEDEWESIIKGSSTGVRIVAPGKINAGHRESPPDDWPAKKDKKNAFVLQKGPLGVRWELFLGGDKGLKKLVKDMDGKSVVVRGTLAVEVQSFGWRFPETIRYIVRVSSLEEAKPSK